MIYANEPTSCAFKAISFENQETKKWRLIPLMQHKEL